MVVWLYSSKEPFSSVKIAYKRFKLKVTSKDNYILKKSEKIQSIILINKLEGAEK